MKVVQAGRWQIIADEQPGGIAYVIPAGEDVAAYMKQPHIRRQQLAKDAILALGMDLHKSSTEVRHDDWCYLYRGRGMCNCDPLVSIATQDGRKFVVTDAGGLVEECELGEGVYVPTKVISLPWKRVLENKLIIQDQLCASIATWMNSNDLGGEYTELGGEWTPLDPPVRARVLAQLLHVVSQPPVVWTDNIFDAASVGDEAFVDTPAVPFDDQWWCREHDRNTLPETVSAFRLPGANADWVTCAEILTCINVIDVGRRIDLATWVFQRVDGAYPQMAIRVVLLGETGREIDNIEAARHYARLRFLSLPFVRIVTEPALTRGQRRRAPARKSDMRVVSLRRAESRMTTPTASIDRCDDGGGRYSHQWIVSGHWRRQWYPARATHEPIWIEPYMKGPDGAPLLARRRTVQQAVR